MIKRIMVLMASIVLLSAFVSAANLNVQVMPISSVVVPEFNEPAVYQLTITNNGVADSFEIYTIVGVSLTPKTNFVLPAGTTTTLIVKAYPNEHILQQRGYLNFEYEIKGENSGVYKDKLALKIVPLSELVEVRISPLSSNSKLANVSVRSLQNSNISDIEVEVETPFFSSSDVLSFGPFESRDLSVSIDSIDKSLAAGQYLAQVSVGKGDVKAKTESRFEYLAEEQIATEESRSGIFSIEKVVKKTNTGNTQVNAYFEIQTLRFTGAFTTISEDADKVVSSGMSTVYSWNKMVLPGKEAEVRVRVNYLYPVIVALLVMLGVWALWQILKTDVVVRKRAVVVRTKGGEFALKIMLNIRARRSVDNAVLHDYVPAVAKLYENYGRTPDAVDANSRKLSWKLGAMNAGESRVFSYVIYSKVHTVGKFELPTASVNYKRGDNSRHSYSNKAYVVSEK